MEQRSSFQISPSFAVSASGVALAGASVERNPPHLSPNNCDGPLMPCLALSAASTPPSAARPACSFLLCEPSWINAHNPPLKLPEMPNAALICPAFSPINFPAAAAAPKTPQVEVECQPAPLWGEYPPQASSTRRATS